MADNHKEEFLQKQLEEASQAAKIYNDTIQMLQTEERFVNFFKGYNQQSVDGFIKYYAGQKAGWIKNADSMYKMRQHKNNKWRNQAKNMLKEIYIKKLFYLKCRWVAGEMDLEGIEISIDFLKWQNDPNACKCLEPITPEEFGCYQRFIESYTPEQQKEDQENEIGSAQNVIEFYHLFRAGFTDESDLIPRWFHYYDKHFGTAHLLKASNIRADLEYEYNDIWTENIQYPTLTEEQKKNWFHRSRAFRKEMHENPEKDKAFWEEHNRQYQERKKNEPQYIHMSTYDRKFMDGLVQEFESAEMRSWYRAQRDWQIRRDGNEEIQTEIWELEKVNEWIPLEANDDYRNAIAKAHDEYASRMIKDVLPLIYDEYRQCMETGKPFIWKEEEDSSFKGSMDETKKRILAARKFKGEPENFDFLKKENLKT